ncbi:MAG: lipoyl(octanoyl) transferase LipB [Alphaproteobacteria bacterium]|nr:lipoyl(octanoyl) transferase LipB [Alphaproteobacteria bacterium]OJV45305.1 MAG: lipoate-protein ligase B [Alphaproteobacteria bacterium 43-37]
MLFPESHGIVSLTHASYLVPYPEALATMESWVESIILGQSPQRLWFLEHPPLYTSGTSGKKEDHLARFPFPVYESGRGGQLTYHGPGQRVAYSLLDLRTREQDLRKYVWHLEEWLILSIKELGVEAFRRDGRIGLWVVTPIGEAKIAAIGVRVKKWVTSHGIAFNVAPDLRHFGGIVPCGLKGFGVTSLADLGLTISMPEVDCVLVKKFEHVFGAQIVES